jgi:hypothetical protein
MAEIMPSQARRDETDLAVCEATNSLYRSNFLVASCVGFGRKDHGKQFSNAPNPWFQHFHQAPSLVLNPGQAFAA